MWEVEAAMFLRDFEVFKVASAHTEDFCFVTPCYLVAGYRRVEGTYR
jgi:hypothetical protein